MKSSPIHAKSDKKTVKKAASATHRKDAGYSVYMVRCADGTLYTGSTNDVEKRLLAHNSSSRGAKYTKPRRPVLLAYVESFKGKNAKSQALKREYVLKRLTRSEKLSLARHAMDMINSMSLT